MVQVSELSFFTDQGRRLLDDIHLGIERGEFLILAGPASSGKTLLLKLLCRELLPQRGQILINNRNLLRIGDEKLRELRRRIGIVPQNFMPPQRGSVSDQLIFKLRCLGYPKGEALRKAIDALDVIGALSLKDKPIKELSQEELVLFYLALAISNDPVLLLVDEPFALLDEAGKSAILEALKRLHARRRITMLVTTREEQLAERSGIRVALLQDGRIASPSMTASSELGV